MATLKDEIEYLIKKDLESKAEKLCAILDSHKGRHFRVSADGSYQLDGTNAPEVQAEIDKMLEIEKTVIRRFLTI